MDLKMEVYSPALELIGLLEAYNSVLWERRAFSAGSFTVSAPLTEQARTLLKPDNILWIEGETAGIIEYIEQEQREEGPSITIKGRELSGILDRRILWGGYNLYGAVDAIMRQLVSDCCITPTRGDVAARVIPGLALAEQTTAGVSVRVQMTGGTLLEALEKLGGTYGVAFGVRFNATVPRMEFWTRNGIDRSVHQTVVDPVFYSTELDDVLSSEYTYNSSDYRNTALVAGEGEGGERTTITVIEEIEVEPEPPEPPEPPVPPTPVTEYTVTLSVNPSDGGTVSGGGQYSDGQTVTVTATNADGYSFVAWRENGQTVSGNSNYVFSVSGNRELVAVFAENQILPDGYTRLEYIQFGNACGIDTMFKPNAGTTRLVMDFECVEEILSSSTFFSETSTTVSGSNRWFSLFALSSSELCYRHNSNSYGTLTTNLLQRMTLDYNCPDGTISAGGTTGTIIKGTYTLSHSLFFGSPYSSDKIASYRIYSSQIYTNENKVRDFVPCKNPSGVVGLYDIIGKSFYKNSLSGTLTAGPEI